jgi:hypothetical protein
MRGPTGDPVDRLAEAAFLHDGLARVLSLSAARCPATPLKGAQERHQILLLLCLEFRTEDQVKEFDRVLQG